MGRIWGFAEELDEENLNEFYDRYNKWDQLNVKNVKALL
jgi:hypothetical protein